jgi:hypothetical protein
MSTCVAATVVGKEWRAQWEARHKPQCSVDGCTILVGHIHTGTGRP